MSFTTSQNITRALNCDSGIVATVASVQRFHVTRIVVGYSVSLLSLTHIFKGIKLFLTEAPFRAEIAAISSALHALIGRYVIIWTEWPQRIQPLATAQAWSSAEVGTKAYCPDWLAAHGN